MTIKEMIVGARGQAAIPKKQKASVAQTFAVKEIDASEDTRRMVDVVALSAFGTDLARARGYSQFALMLFDAEGNPLMSVGVPGTRKALFQHCEERAANIISRNPALTNELLSEEEEAASDKSGWWFMKGTSYATGARRFVYGEEEGEPRLGVALACGLPTRAECEQAIEDGLSATGRVLKDDASGLYHLFSADTSISRRHMSTLT
mmetsp:Transcript_1115/g.3145  ORF Transcript_1115/g.3145 Transcript_1115/m.3145 type:complete len:206 (-) Transcript_1115:78-695(-)